MACRKWSLHHTAPLSHRFFLLLLCCSLFDHKHRLTHRLLIVVIIEVFYLGFRVSKYNKLWIGTEIALTCAVLLMYVLTSKAQANLVSVKLRFKSNTSPNLLTVSS